MEARFQNGPPQLTPQRRAIRFRYGPQALEALQEA